MMTFSMSECDQSTKIDMEEEGDDEVGMSIKEIEEEKKKEKEKQQRDDDIALVICMICLVLLTVMTVTVKVMFFDPVPDPNATTFRPLKQEVKSNEMYTGNGYMPCNGYIPCQPEYLSPKELAERIKDAGPCHDYLDRGAGPEGCW